MLLRVGIAAAAIAAIVGAAVIWLHTSTEEPELQVATRGGSAPGGSPPPVAPVVAPAQPRPRPGRQPPAAAAVDAPAEPVAAKPPREAARPTTERAAQRGGSTGHAAARPGLRAPNTTVPAPSPRRRAAQTARPASVPSLEDDPDGTLAPSIE